MLSTKIFCALITRQGRVAVYSAALLCCNTSLFLHQLKVEWILFHYYYRLSIIRQDLIITSEAIVMNKCNNIGIYGGSVWEYCLCLTLVCSRFSVSRLLTDPRLAHTPAPGSLRFSLTCKYFLSNNIFLVRGNPTPWSSCQCRAPGWARARQSSPQSGTTSSAPPALHQQGLGPGPATGSCNVRKNIWMKFRKNIW